MHTTRSTIANYITTHYADVHPVNSWGELSFFLNPGQQLKRGSYFATLKSKDGENDKASHLNREGVHRLNIGLPKPDYLSLFDYLPERPAKGQAVTGYDFTQINTILPHPVYAWMGWVCILNPDFAMFETCKPLLDKAYAKAAELTAKKLAQSGR